MILSFNKNVITTDQIKKYAGTSHGLSLIALTMIDKKNEGLKITAQYTNAAQLQDASTQILAVLKSFQPIKVKIRSIKKDGNFLSYYDNLELKLEHSDEVPSDPTFYAGNYKIILDIEINNVNQRWKFYQSPEYTPRELLLTTTLE